MGEQFLAEIIPEVWAIHPKLVQAHMPAIMKAIKGENITFGNAKELRENAVEKSKVKFVDISGSVSGGSSYEISNQRTFRNIDNNCVAIITVNGVVRKESGYCHKGTNETLHEIRLAGEHPKVIGTIFRTHSGGGSVFGTQSVGNELFNFRKTYSKPCYGLIDSQADSAAYWMVSQCDKVYIVNNTCEAGCIGTMSTFFDYTGMMEMEGIKEIIVRASLSFNKNEEYYQAFQGNLEPLRLNILDPLNAEFHKDVIRGRKNSKGFDLKTKVEDDKGNKVPEILSGITLYGSNIVKKGLADGVATLQQVISMVEKESRKITRASNTNSNIDMEKKDFEALDAMDKDGLTAYVASSESPEIGVMYANALIGKIDSENSKSDLQSNFDSLKSDSEEKDSTISSLKQEVKDEQAKLVGSDSENTALKAKNGTLTTTNSSLSQKNEGLEAKVLVLESDKSKLETKVGAFETFINSQYGEEAALKFVPGADGNINQPELELEDSKKKKTAKTAKSIIKEMRSKRNQKKD